ncbi:tetratricopeptide repeat protein [Robiginitalea sp. M366]|uniref:tetratricopeptide repeat protein n=1 Tax=Robiginitalea aestuariiviva TaxID=3036903 RepID=UPI00240D9E64|nr:tetratricopeptide repeat protein [Robiginitalea aestuariiviva]MDG1571336.1 tetratricopeptide repeat protein [Robiginitalea aestuariiviva]
MGKKITAFIMALLGATALAAQAPSIQPPAKTAVDQTVRSAPTTFREIDSRLQAYSQDTLMLTYFIRQSEMHAYREGLAYAYNQIGSYYRSRSDFERAMDNHNKALNQAKAAENREFQIYSLNQLGATDLAMESIKSALDYYQEAMNLAENLKDPSVEIQREINTSINGIGHIYRLLELYDLAIEYFQKSLSYDLALGNLRGQAINHQNIAECLEARGRLEEAMAAYQASEAANREVSSPRIEVVNKYGMAHVLAHEGEDLDSVNLIQRAVGLLASAIPTAEALGDQEVLSSSYIQMGWALSLLRRFPEARDYLQKGLEISMEYQLFSNIYQANTFLHDIAKEQGNFREALELYDRAQSARRKISNDRNRRYVYEFISRSEEEKRISQIELLSRENEIVKLQLRRNRTTLLVGALILTLFILILYIIYRQYQLSSERKVISLEQSMLRSQMNPHFLFNSLNSIKLYIINNEQKNAVHYLNKFSKLVRKILEASSVREIPLEEELETVELYMNIENIRFNNEIDFSVEVAPEIDTSLVRIPSLILQPFLENALWHGLSSKEGRKVIRIEISRSGPGYIDIRIRDNGIGRAAAEALKQQRVLKRKSLGLEITKERMANFSKDYQNTYDMKMEDLFDEAGNPCGTLVTLRIPTV